MTNAGPSSGTERPAASGTLGTIRNASVLLELLSDGPAYQQLSDLAERSGLSVPTVHRLLRSLIAAGLVEQDPSSARYGLGAELVHLAERYLRRQPLMQGLMPYLVDLRNRTGATVLIAMLVGETVIYVERIDGDDGALLRRSERSFPCLDTPAGRLLASRGDAQLWQQLSDGQGRERIAELEHWASCDHLVDQLESPRGHLEVAVPVLRADGSASAALAATGGPPRFADGELVEVVLPELRQTAELAGRLSSHAG